MAADAGPRGADAHEIVDPIFPIVLVQRKILSFRVPRPPPIPIPSPVKVHFIICGHFPSN